MLKNKEYLRLLVRLDEKRKEVKRVYDELSKIIPKQDVGKHKKYNEIYQQWRTVAQKFLKLYVYL